MYLELSVASKMDLRAAIRLVEEGGVGHRGSSHVVVLPVHSHLLGEGSNGGYSLSVHL